MSTEEHRPNHHNVDGKMAEPGLEAAPDQSQDAPATDATDAAQKRKASWPTGAEYSNSGLTKRPRVVSEKTHGNANDNTEETPGTKPQSTRPVGEIGRDRREMARQEEKKRGKRLLGGLMNTLNQASAGSQHRRRQDIERRQQVKSAQQQAEEDRLRIQKLAQLEVTRKIKQIKFDEQVMETKHADMLAKARFLHTKAQPMIFYRPWELTRAQKATIDDQIQQTEETIEKQVAEFKERKVERLRSLGVTVKAPVPVETPALEKDKAVAEPNDELPADKPPPESTNRPSSRATNKAGTEKESDKADDVMIEEDEDTVIY